VLNLFAGSSVDRGDDVYPLPRLLLAEGQTSAADLRSGANKGFRPFITVVGEWAINHRWKVLLGSFILLAGGGLAASPLKSDFFPKDLSYLSYLMCGCRKMRRFSARMKPLGVPKKWLREAAQDTARCIPGKMGSRVRSLNHSPRLVGGGGPRFWFSSRPSCRS